MWKPLDTRANFLDLTTDDGPLGKCNRALMDLMSQLTPASGIRAKLSQRAMWAWRKDKVEKSLQTIVKQKMAFLELLSVDQMSQAVDVGHTLNELSEAQIEAKKNEIIKWLSPTDPRTNQEAARKKHEDQTGNWFTGGSEYTTWLEQPNSFLWLQGIPGCGKTVLCSEIIEETSAYCRAGDDHYLAYFFFSFRDTDKQKASNLPRSILSQLLQRTVTMPKTLQTFHEEYQHGEPSERGVMDAIQALLTGPYIFIIIDALDECPNTDEERAELCNILQTIHSWGYERLHLLVTSRTEADLTEALQPIITQPPLSIQGAVVDADIRKFVKTQLQTNPKLSKWSPELRSEIEETLVKKSGGMFRWVVCQLHSLSKCLCPSDIRIALSSLPRTLDETYERILLNVPIEYRPKAISALRWILYSKGQLSPKEVADAIVINPEADPPFNLSDRIPDPFWISELLPGLINIIESQNIRPNTGPHHILEIAHFSVVEYLESTRIMHGPAPMFRLEKQQGNISILKDCFRIFKSCAHPTNQLLIMKGRKRYVKLPFSALDNYARYTWLDHVELLETPIEPEIASLILDFTLNIKSIPRRYLRYSRYYRTYIPDWTRIMVRESCGPLANGLYIASRYGLTNMAKIFLEAGANVNTSGGCGTVLQAAIRAGDRRQKLVGVLLDAGADANIGGGHYGTALQTAAARGLYSIVKILLDAKAEVNMQDGFHGSALRAAQARGHQDIVSLLLSAGARDDTKIPLE